MNRRASVRLAIALSVAGLAGCPDKTPTTTAEVPSAAPSPSASSAATPAVTGEGLPVPAGSLKLFAPPVPITTDAAIPIPTDPVPDAPGSRCGEARFAIVRPEIKVGAEKPKRGAVVHPAVDVTPDGGKSERVFLPLCNGKWPACTDFGSCAALEKNDLLALEPPAQGAIAGLRCEGPQPMSFVLVKGRVGLDVLASRPRPGGKLAWSPVTTTALKSSCAKAGAVLEATREVRVDP